MTEPKLRRYSDKEIQQAYVDALTAGWAAEKLGPFEESFKTEWTCINHVNYTWIIDGMLPIYILEVFDTSDVLWTKPGVDIHEDKIRIAVLLIDEYKGP